MILDNKLSKREVMSENENSERENTPEPDDLSKIYTAPSLSNLKPGTYVLVKICTGKRKSTNYLYVGIIQENLPYQEFLVTALKSLDSSHTTFKLVESDVFTVPIEDIQAVLPALGLSESE